nr:beta-ACP synthase [Blastocatellia bacterium]
MRRVVITGIGVVSAIGNDVAQFWQSVQNGRSGIGPITKIDTANVRFKNAAEVRGFDAAEHFEDRTIPWLDPFSQFGIVAAREAITDSGIEFDDALREDTGVVTGSCLGGKESEDKLFSDLYDAKKTRFPPTAIPAAMANAVASHVAIEFGLTGPT